ncbi:MAG: FLgD tudor-like domain-containing protein [Legionellales bacterium]
MTELDNNTNMEEFIGTKEPENLDSDSLGQPDFLRLMTAQVHSQELANDAFLNHLAQFGSNEGLTNIQNTMQELVSSLQSNQALQASALVGRKVMVSSSVIHLGTRGDVDIAIDVPEDINYLVAYINSGLGELIRTITLGRPPAGLLQFLWDGKDDANQRAPNGAFIVEVRGSYRGKKIALRTMTTANVDSVNLGHNGEGITLNVSGVGSVPLEEVRQIRA